MAESGDFDEAVELDLTPTASAVDPIPSKPKRKLRNWLISS